MYLLFRPVDDSDVVLQFSLRKDWDQKIKETCKRLQETTPDVSVLIYGTNQVIGASTNDLKKTIRKDYRIFLDIRDQEWFLTVRNRSAAVQAEAEQFMQPFDLEAKGGQTALARQAQALDDLEAKAAFVYLGLQWQDCRRSRLVDASRLAAAAAGAFPRRAARLAGRAG